jgi:hypothetical protein
VAATAGSWAGDWAGQYRDDALQRSEYYLMGPLGAKQRSGALQTPESQPYQAQGHPCTACTGAQVPVLELGDLPPVTPPRGLQSCGGILPNHSAALTMPAFQPCAMHTHQACGAQLQHRLACAAAAAARRFGRGHHAFLQTSPALLTDLISGLYSCLALVFRAKLVRCLEGKVGMLPLPFPAPHLETRLAIGHSLIPFRLL